MEKLQKVIEAREMLSSELTEEENERNEKIDMRKIQDDINRRRK